MLWFYASYFYKATLNTPVKEESCRPRTWGSLKCRVLLDLQRQKLQDGNPGFEEHGQDLPVLLLQAAASPLCSLRKCLEAST